MNELEIFRYALYPVGADYSQTDLKERVSKCLCELAILLGNDAHSVDYNIDYRYRNEHDYFWLVAFAQGSRQLPLKLTSVQETIMIFTRRLQERVLSLPLVLNLAALEIDAQRYNIHSPAIGDRQLASLIVEQGGKTPKFKVSDRFQESLYPSLDPFILDPHSRFIQCKIKSLSKLEAAIYEIEDQFSTVSKSTKVPLIFIPRRFNREIFDQISECLFMRSDIQFIVNARINILNSSTVEYELQSVVN